MTDDHFFSPFTRCVLGPCPLHGDLDVKNKIMQHAPLSFGLSAGCHEREAWSSGSLCETLGKLCRSFRPSRTARVFC